VLLLFFETKLTQRTIQEFFVLVAQLEHQAHTDATFSLQKVWFYLDPSLRTMEVLAGLLSALEVAEKEYSGSAQDLKLTFVKKQQFGGAQMLNILSERMVSCSG
jgi:gamma-tubulin complex component 2